MSLPTPNAERIRQCIQSALDLNDQSKLLSLSDEDAQIALDEMWRLLDLLAFPSADISRLHVTRNKLRRLSLKLAIKHNKLPLALFLQDVQCKDTNHRGAGGFADVFYGSVGGVAVAVKRLRVYMMSSETEKNKLKQAFYRESLLWKNLIHKHVLPFLGVSEDVFPGTICMVLPWMDNGSIRHHIDTLQKQGKLAGADYAVAVDIWLYEVGLGLVYLHDEGIVHGDLHGGNILIDANDSIRLTDFGMSLISEATAYNYASMHGGGATRWTAPELIYPEEFGFTSSRPTYCSDVYSFGCTCIELYTGAPPFAGLTDPQVITRILKKCRPSRPSIPNGSLMSDAMWSFVTSCWAEKPLDRPLATDVVQSLGEITSPVETTFASTPKKTEEAPDTLLEDVRATLTTPTVQHVEAPQATPIAGGPLLEETAPKVADPPESEEVPLTESQNATMSTEERKQAAVSLKVLGNSAFTKHEFAAAVDLYTQAIAVTPTPEPVFYSNRAACYMSMKPPVYESVVRDCDSALKLDKRYVKPLVRRGIALEAFERYEDSLRDFTAAIILEQFRNDNAAQSVERVLKKLASKKAAEIIGSREPRLPSHNFLTGYFGAFRNRQPPALPKNPTMGDRNLVTALQALAASDYAHSFSLINEALDQVLSNKEFEAEALNLRGTFKFLYADIDGAKADLQASLDIIPSFTQSLVKLAIIHMEQGDPANTFECFEEAIEQNSYDPDIYYHRGQMLLIMNKFEQAVENYTKSAKLDGQFVYSHTQLAIAQYKAGHIANSEATFRRTLKVFPHRSEPFNYYGEVLLGLQRYPDALKMFDKAIEIEKARIPPSPMKVIALVNKAVTLYRKDQNNFEVARKHCEDALALDPQYEAAVATLAYFYLRQDQLPKAVEKFERQVELARTKPQLFNVLKYQFATLAQIKFVKNYPEMADQVAVGMMQMQ